MRHLAALPLFEHCAREDLRRVVRHGDVVEVDAGAALLREGRTDYWFYVILRGAVEVTRSGRHVATLTRGDHAGEVAIIGHGLQPASVVASERSVLFVLARRPLLSFASTVIPFQRRLFPESSGRAFVDIQHELSESGRHDWDRVARRWRRLDEQSRERAVAELHSLALPGRPVTRSVLATAWPDLSAATRSHEVVETPRLSRRAKVLLVLAAALSAMTGALVYHPPVAVVRPAAAIDVVADIDVVGLPVHRPAARYLLLPVRIERPSLAALGIAKLGGERIVHVDKAESTHASGLQAFRDSERLAVAAAAAATGVDPHGLTVRFRRRDIGGPSGGLVYAIALADMLEAGDLAGGATVAATGALDSEGHVSPVGFVDVKSREARAARADILLVPDGQHRGGGARVHGVSTVRDALRVLRSVVVSGAR